MFRILGIAIGVFLFIIQSWGKNQQLFDSNLMKDTRQEIKVIDSLKIDLSRMDSTICIDGGVVMGFASDSVFACEWIDVATGDTISKSKVVTLNPKTTTQYQVNLYYFTGELIKNGNFEGGTGPENKGFETDYIYPVVGESFWNGKGWFRPVKGDELWGEGTYRIGKNPGTFHSRFYKISDHTSGKGNMMIVNGSDRGNMIVWKQTVKNIEKDRIYAFSTWSAVVGEGNPALFHFTINGKTLGDDFQLEDFGKYHPQWDQFYRLWEADKTEAEIALVNINTNTSGNDFAIDDISFASMEKKTGVITVKVLPAVNLDKLSDKDVCEGDSIVLNAQATGTGITGYRWTKGGQVIPTTTSLFKIEHAALGDAGDYLCSVTGECGTRVQPVQIDVRENLKIGKLRDTIRRCEHTPVTLSATTQGYLPVYLWSAPKAGIGWEGKENAEYTNNDLVWSRDTGVYTCKVSTQCGDTTVYRVIQSMETVKITDWPGDMSVCEGTDVRLYAETNIVPYAITWGGKNMNKRVPGNEIILKNVGIGDGGVYNCIALDECLGGDYKTLMLRVTPAMTYLQVSEDTVVCEYSRVALQAEADGVKTTYEWRGPSGFKAYTAKIVIDSFDESCEGVYEVTATDSCGKSMSEFVTVSLLKEYEELNITENQQVCPGDFVRLEVTGGKETMVYDWTTPKGNHIAGSGIEIKAEEGGYVCRISGVCTPVEKRVDIKFKETLQAHSGESSFLVCPGESVLLKAEATGNVVEYEWWKEEVKLGEGSEKSLNNLTSQDAGNYECRIRSTCGDTVLYYQIQLKQPLKIVGHLPDRYTKRGENILLFVDVTGDNQRVYQWEHGGKIIAGATNNLIHIQTPDTDTLLVYTCRVTGCNEEQVTFYIHVKDYYPVYQDTTVVLCPGQAYSYKVEGVPEECNYTAVWVNNKKDTVERTPVLTFDQFSKENCGEYICHLDSDCGGKVVHLQVEAYVEPEIIDIYTDLRESKQGVIPVCAGEDVVLVARVKAEGLVTYQWYYNETLLSGETGAELELHHVTAAQEGRYSCRLISAVCGEDMKEISLQVNTIPVISGSPEMTYCPGQAAKLEVKVIASQPSNFDWKGPQSKDWIAQSNGFSAYYSRSSVNEASEGIYYCEVNNLCGQEILSFKVNIEKDIVSPEFPHYDTICPGSTVTYTIPPAQDGAKYVWTFPNQVQQEGKTIFFEHFSVADTGKYQYYIETANGCFNYSGEVHLLLRKELEEPRISPDTSVCEGSAVVFTAFAEGKEVNYEWLGPKGFRARGDQIHLEEVTDQHCGVYEVVVTDICNQKGKRSKVELSLLKEFENLQITPELVVCEGSDAHLILSGGTEGLNYKWLYHGQVRGQEAELVVENVTIKDTGVYLCQIEGVCESKEEKVALHVYNRLWAEKSEIIPVCEREDATLSVNASGNKLTYRWMRDDEEVGDRRNVLELIDVIPSDSGKYECQVSSLCGDTTLVYDFRLKEKTRIWRHSADRILCEDDPYQLKVEAFGENNSFIWKRDGRLLLEQGAILDEPALGKSDTLQYTCVVEGDCGIDSVSIIIKIGEYRKLVENLEDTICEGGNYKYNVGIVPEGASHEQELTYRWTFGDSLIYDGPSSLAPFVEVRPDQAGEYLCEVSAVVGTDTVSENVYLMLHVVRLPQLISLSPDIYAVEGSCDSIKIEMSGDELTYSWLKDGELTGYSAADWYFDPILDKDKGEYKITVTNRCGHVQGKVNVEVWKKTVIVYPQERDDSVCMGGHIDLGVIAWGESGLRYKWYLNGELLNVPLTQPLILTDINEMDQGQYVCIVTGRGGTDSCKINLDVLELPKVDIQGRMQLCQDEIGLSQNYIGSSDQSRVDYQWDIVGGMLEGNVNLEKIAVKWIDKETDRLILKVTSLTSGCESQAMVDIRFFPLPEVNLIVPDRVGYCQDSLKLELAYPWGGKFYVNEQETEIVHFRDKTIPYVVRYNYQDVASGCSASVEDTIRLASEPRLQLAEDTITSGWCVPVNMKVKEHSEDRIRWDGEQAVDATDVLNAVYRASQYFSQDFKFWASLEDSFGCLARDSVVVSLLPSPEVILMKDTTIGSCSELVLTAEFDQAVISTINWKPAGALSILDDFHAEVLKNEVGSNLYSVSVSDQYGCVGSDTVRVLVEAAPVLEDREICFGDSIRIETENYAEQIWEDGFLGEVRILKEPGNYHLAVKDQYGCWGEVTYNIHELPVVQLQDTSIYEGQEMEYIVEENGEYGPYHYKWQDGSRRNSFVAKEEGIYRVIVTDHLGCWASDSTFLEVRKWYIAAPDAFLPGSSGENSRFYLKEVNFGSHFQMFIYDRWGELLFKTDEIGQKGGWDGSFKGMKCQPGAYVWVAFVDGKEVGRGTLMLIK